MEWGLVLAFVAAALAVVLPGMGSSKAVGACGETASGVSTENPEVNSKLLVLQLLPATQGIYGFIIGLIASAQLKAGMDAASGWAVFAAVMPMAISGLISGFMQGKCAANCIYAVGKQESLSGKLIVYPGMIEFYAILGLIISIMLVGGLTVTLAPVPAVTAAL